MKPADQFQHRGCSNIFDQPLRARAEISTQIWASRRPDGRREERAYREDVSDEQRCQPGCIGGQICVVISALALTAFGRLRSSSFVEVSPKLAMHSHRGRRRKRRATGVSVCRDVLTRTSARPTDRPASRATRDRHRDEGRKANGHDDRDVRERIERAQTEEDAANQLRSGHCIGVAHRFSRAAKAAPGVSTFAHQPGSDQPPLKLRRSAEALAKAEDPAYEPTNRIRCSAGSLV